MLIAYVLPGMFLAFSLSLHVPTLREWLGAASAANDITVGSAVFLLLTSTLLSLLLAAVRYLVFERLHDMDKVCKKYPLHNEAAMVIPEVWAAHDVITDHHYRYFQCYGSLFVAVPLSAALAADVPVSWGIKIGGLILAALIEYTLWCNAIESMNRFFKKRSALVQLPPKETHAERTPAPHP